MRAHRQRLLLATTAVLGLWAAGCDARSHRLPESGATLTGTVVYGKEKVAVAMIIAQGAGGAATAFVDDDGHYALENVPLGEVSLAVNTEAGKGNMMSRVMARSQSRDKSKPALPKAINLPGRYADPTSSGIKTTINPGANTFDIVIPK